jgi:hypothetical protein
MMIHADLAVMCAHSVQIEPSMLNDVNDSFISAGTYLVRVLSGLMQMQS